MALPRLDYQAPDFLGQVGQGVGSAAKVAEGLTPAHPLVAKALRRIYAGDDPQRVASETKFEMSRQPAALPAMPDAQPRTAPIAAPTTNYQGAGQGNAYWTKALESIRSLPPRGQSSRRTSRWWASLPPAPAQPTRQPSPPAAQPEVPILNRDLPALMQGAGLVRREGADDLRLLELGLRERGLLERQRQFDSQEGLRQAREELIRAQVSGIPGRIDLARRNLAARWAGIGVAEGNLAARENENFLRGTKDTAWTVPALDSVLNAIATRTDVAPDEMDYYMRRAGDVLGQAPIFGKMAKAGVTSAADARLAQPQRDLRRQVELAVTLFRVATVGTQITEGEQAIINKLMGEQMSIEDTQQALMALRQMMDTRLSRYEAAYPSVNQRLGGRPTQSQALPPPAPAGFSHPSGFMRGTPPPTALPADLPNDLFPDLPEGALCIS